MQIKISKLALADINAIWLYTKERWSMEQAAKYYDMLFDKFEHLAEFPDSGKTAESIGRGYRHSQVRSHMIFYKIDDQSKALEIIRVLHERMDFILWLNE